MGIGWGIPTAIRNLLSISDFSVPRKFFIVQISQGEKITVPPSASLHFGLGDQSAHVLTNERAFRYITGTADALHQEKKTNFTLQWRQQFYPAVTWDTNIKQPIVPSFNRINFLPSLMCSYSNGSNVMRLQLEQWAD